MSQPVLSDAVDLNYAFHLFGYHPQEIINDVLVAVETATDSGIQQLQERLESNDDLDPQIVEKGCSSYKDVLCETALSIYDTKLRDFLERFLLPIPTDTVLPGDVGKEMDRTDRRSDLDKLSAEILQEKCYQLALNEKIRKLEQAEARVAEMQERADSVSKEKLQEVRDASAPVLDLLEGLAKVTGATASA